MVFEKDTSEMVLFAHKEQKLIVQSNMKLGLLEKEWKRHINLSIFVRFYAKMETRKVRQDNELCKGGKWLDIQIK